MVKVTFLWPFHTKVHLPDSKAEYTNKLSILHVVNGLVMGGDSDDLLPP